MWNELQSWVKKHDRTLTVLVSSITLTALLLNLDFNFLEANLYDLRVSRGIQTEANSDIILITLDDATTKELNEFAPLPLDYHSRFLESLEAYGPKAIGYLVDMNHVNQVNPDLFRSA